MAPLLLAGLLSGSGACSEPLGSQPTEATDTTDGAVIATTSTTSAPSTTSDLPTWRDASGELTFELLETLPHDSGAFTQGLEIVAPGVLVESTGLRGQSDRRLVDLATGEVTAEVALSDDEFGEGITMVGQRFIQLTWQKGVAIESDAASLEETGRFSYEGEGWGLCYDNERLVHSDGTSELRFRDPVTFEVEGSQPVTLDGAPLTELNELECVDDVVLANVWQTPNIVVIDPTSGVVQATVDLSELYPEGTANNSSTVLNGIAYDDANDTFLVTGKHWPLLYRIRLVPA